ncbi:MAG: FkbM family methyltransferase [Bacteroidetes bacterium]|nr:FkbM family methyltransferase [Bacteroidota bacterium]
METTATQYRPSLSNPSKYLIYLDYFKEYIACKDFKSLGASLKYVFTHKLPKEDFQTSSRMGKFQIRKQTTDFQFINYAYERKIKEYMEKNLDSFDVFIDAGACIGEYCIWLAKLGKKCIAIEPVNFEAVRKNIALNNLEDKVQLFTVGLGDKKERVYFYIPNGLPSSSFLDREGAAGKEPNVDIETLDELSKRFNIPPGSRILMKMDVEGMEPELIEGGKEFIKNTPNLSFIYEHFESDNYRNDKALLALAPFKFQDLDPVNRLAIKS